MTVMSDRGLHMVYCNGCGAELSEHDEFQEAVNEAKREGWTIKNEGGTWSHLCRACDEPAVRAQRLFKK